MDAQLHILILEDNASDAELVKRELRKAGLDFAAQVTQDKQTYLHALDASAPDLILADYSLPGYDGLTALSLARQRFPEVPVIIVSGAIGEETAIEALKAGATDYVLKQRLSRLGPVVKRALLEAKQLAEKNLAQEELARQREWLSVTLTSIGDAVIATDTAARVTFLNPVAAQLSGWTPEEAVGQPIGRVFSVINEKTRQPADDVVARVLRDKRIVALANDTALLAKDGREIPVEDSAAPILDSAGDVMGVVLVFHDVTAKRRAVEALRSVAHFLDENPHPVLRIDRAGTVLYANQSSAVLGGPWRCEAGHPSPEPLGRLARETLDRGKASRMDVESGGRVFSFVFVPIADSGYVNLYGRDITDRKRVEEELKAAKESAEQAKAAAEQANRAKDHFLAVLSHEMRTPLTPVVMGLSMLRDRPGIDPAMRETLEMIRRNVELEARLIDDLLDVSRIARGKIELNRSPVELHKVINRAVEVCKPDIEARRLHFGVEMGQTTPYWVEADVPRLQQVFWNLLKNAIKFTPHGGCVGIRCRPNGTHVVIEVNDSGIGIEPEALTRVFNAFEQVEQSITRQFGGLGLGLAISKALVEMHGGTISAHSEGPNKGATFRILLPLTAPADQPEVPLPAAPAQRAVRPMRILLVEDHGVTAKMMRMVLTAEGHSLETAGDVATALELADQYPFDLLVSDLGLPDGSGHDLMRQLRERGHKFPGIALSGYGQEEDIRRSREAGFAAHLTKPASREAVVETIASVAAGERTMTTSKLTVASESPPRAQSPVFDADLALKRCLNNRELLQKMIAFFVQDADDSLPRMRVALQKGDLVEVGRLGHRLKGSIAHIGAEAAGEAALRVEYFLLHAGDEAQAEEAVRALERECEVLKQALSAHQTAAPPAASD